MLVVDDSDAALRKVQRLLEADGHDVALAHDWREWRTALVLEPALILVDVTLPGFTSGDHLAAELRKHPFARDARIVLYSAAPQIDLQQMANDSGADGLIHKSTVDEDFMVLVARYLGLDRPEGSETGGD